MSDYDEAVLASLCRRLLGRWSIGSGYRNLLPENWMGPVGPDDYDPHPARLTLDASWDLSHDEYALCERIMTDEATPPVPAAPVVPPAPSLADLVYTEAPDHESYQSDKAWSPVVPAATDEPALAVIVEGLVHAVGIDPDGADMEGCNEVARAVVAALEANGYRIVKET